MNCIECFLFECNNVPKNTFLFNNIENYLDKRSLDLIDEHEKTIVFGYHVNLSSLNKNSISHLIFMMRKYSDHLRNIVINIHDFIPSYKTCTKTDLEFLRKEIINALIVLKNLILNSKLNCCVDDKKFILNQLKYFLLSLNRISCLPEIVFYELNTTVSNCKSASNQLFHLYLEVWWNIYEIFKKTDKELLENLNLIRDVNYVGDILNQFQNIILSDLVFVSLSKFHTYHLENNFYNLNPFICDCTKLAFTLLYKNYNIYHQNNSDLHLFWRDFNKIIDCLNNNLSTFKPNESIKNFNWVKPNKKFEKNFDLSTFWLITNLASIFDDESSNNQLNNFNFQNESYVLNIVKNLIKSEDNLENINYVRLSNIIKLCFKLSNYWDLKIDFILPILDFFMKRLNSFFSQNNVEKIQILPKSGFVWQKKLKTMINNISNIENEEDLRILLYCLNCTFLQKCVFKQNSNSQTQKFKGRFYSKLQVKKIEDLKEIGIFNLFNLILIIIYTSSNHWQDLLDKYSFIIKIIKTKLIYSSKIAIIFKSLFCCIYMLETKEENSKVIDVTINLFNEICDEIPEWNSNNIQSSTIHNSYFDLINIYFNEIYLYLKHQTNYSFYFKNLITNKIAILLPKLSDREHITILQHLNSILNTTIEKIESKDFSVDLMFYSEIYQSTKNQFFDFLKTKSSFKNCDQKLSEIIFSFSYLSTLICLNEQDFKTFLQTFVFNKNVNSIICCDLISKIIENESTNVKLLDCFSNCLEKKILELWFKFSINLNHPNANFDKLSHHLSKLFKIFNSNHSGLKNVEDIFKNLFNKFVNLTNNEKINMAMEINQCMNEIVSTGKVILRDENYSNEILNQFYIILSNLVEICSEMLYIQGNNDMLLPQILEIFYNPLYIQTLPSSRHQLINNAIRKTLPNFLNGMTSFQVSNDVYLKRKLKQTFSFYIPMFMSKTATHPILLAFKNDEKIKKSLLIFILDFLNESFFSKAITNPAFSAHIIQFIQDMFFFIKHNENLREEIFNLYPNLLDKLLKSEELIKRRIRKCLQSITNEMRNCFNKETFKTKLTKFYDEFIKNNKNNLVKVIRALEYLDNLTFFDETKENIISILMYLINDLEQSSFGIDNQIRITFQQFVNKITNK